MNDDQRKKMLAVLAKAFDNAAVKCSTDMQAAAFIESELKAAGFYIAMRKR